MTDTSIATPNRRCRSAASQLLIGILIIVVGLLFTLENLGVAHVTQYLQYWPAGLIAIGLVKLWDSREGHGGALGGFLTTLVGLWLLLESVVDIRISFSDMWPMLLVFVGGYLVWRGVTGPRRAVSADDHSVLSAVAILSGVNRGSNSPAFRGGDLTAVMGGCEIDLRQAAINGDATINVFGRRRGQDAAHARVDGPPAHHPRGHRDGGDRGQELARWKRAALHNSRAGRPAAPRSSLPHGR